MLALVPVYDFGRKMGVIPESHPKFRWTKLGDAPEEDELNTPGQRDEICKATLLDPEALEWIALKDRPRREAQELSGRAFQDFLCLLQYAGRREHETGLQRWSDVASSPPEKRRYIFYPGKYTKTGGGETTNGRLKKRPVRAPGLQGASNAGEFVWAACPHAAFRGFFNRRLRIRAALATQKTIGQSGSDEIRSHISHE